MTSGLAIYDTMQYVLTPVCTWCVGQAASMGSLLLAAGAPGMRHALPNARIMVHQPSGGARVRPGQGARGAQGARGCCWELEERFGEGGEGFGETPKCGEHRNGEGCVPLLCVCGEGALKEGGQRLEGRKGITWVGGDVLGPPPGDVGGHGTPPGVVGKAGDAPNSPRPF